MFRGDRSPLGRPVTVIRGIVPAAVRLTGSANRWALRRLHERIGVREEAVPFRPAGIRAV